MKAIIQKDLFTRSSEVFSSAAHKHGIQFFQTNVLAEKVMLELHKEGTNCFVIGAEAYSQEFYNSLQEGSAVIRYGVGYNAIPVDICKIRKIKVAYTPGTLTDSVAEYTFVLLLAVARSIPVLHQSMKDGLWKGITGMELKGKTIAIIGFGQIGQAVARIAKYGFGMRVNAFDIIKITGSDLCDQSSDNFEETVKDADIISLHLATLPSTMGFINTERISQMKDGAIFLNTARGELVVEKDLFDALMSGKISAAGLDVFAKEPYHPTPDVDFRKLDNVVLAPHCGSNTSEASNRMAEKVVENILAYYSGNKMIIIPELNIKD
ncbi:MAG: NAD(P)-dependent oxidoreductase [Bacteroidetes bacterium]|nr:NAD(P)-dependent oxidoreductase [Bacteroidota bacterium]MDA1120908.1 NAD(P)-dependent oxidoreductase [Bacteroidota bacterium]